MSLLQNHKKYKLFRSINILETDEFSTTENTELHREKQICDDEKTNHRNKRK